MMQQNYVQLQRLRYDRINAQNEVRYARVVTHFRST